METQVVEQGKADSGIITGGERTLQEQTKPKPLEIKKVPMPETDAELEKRRKDIAISMGWAPKEKVPEPPEPAKEDEPKKPEGEAAPVKEGEEAKPAAAAPPAPDAPKPEATDTEAIIARTAKAVGEQVGKAITDAQPAAPEPEPEAVEPELTPEDARDLEAITKMEELHPASKGKAAEFKKFALARYEYETDWREKNPGRAFNPDDPDHEDFYRKQPDIDEDALEAAKIELIVDRKVEQRVAPVLRKISSDKAMREAEPKIGQAVNVRVVEMVKSVNPELAKLLHDGDRIDLSQRNADRIKAKDPIAARVFEPMVMGELVPMIVELEKTVAPGLDYQLDPKNNRVHARIAEYVQKFESETAAKPAARVRDGREFQTIEQRNQRVQQVLNSKASPAVQQQRVKAIDDRYWTASVDDIEDAIVKDISTRARKEIDELDGLAKAKYRPTPKTAATPAPAKTDPEPEPQVPAVNGKPRPPSVESQGTVVDTAAGAKGKEKSFGETAVAVHWGG